jgi:crotonobetainyl-CoA:carnitine CoA-transferase CaiB-like acyl-CoA transferase
MTEQAPLAGVRVLEIADGMAAAATGRAFADLGADVIKLEPPGGSQMRKRPRLFDVMHAGKRSASIAKDRLAEVFDAVASAADCLLVDDTGWAGHDVVQLATERGSAVVFVFGDGHDGTATSAAIWHASGQSAVDAGHGVPLAPPGNIPFYDTAMTAMFAYLAVRWSEQPNCEGDREPFVIRIDTTDVELTHGRLDLTRAANGQVPMQKDPFLALFIQCSDGEVGAHVNRSYWKTWSELIGRPELDDDPRFTTMADLLANRAEVLNELQQWTTQQRREDVERLAQERGLPVGSVLTPSQVLGDPQLQHRRFVGADGIPAFYPFLQADGPRWLPQQGSPPIGPPASEGPLWQESTP